MVPRILGAFPKVLGHAHVHRNHGSPLEQRWAELGFWDAPPWRPENGVSFVHGYPWGQGGGYLWATDVPLHVLRGG